MTKEKATISIDSDVLEKARKQIPNLSGFLENCLKNYLGIGNSLVPVFKMNELTETISKCQLELYLMNEQNKIEENIKKAAADEIRIAWMKLYAEYRDQRIINQDKLKHASETLNVPEEELIDIVEVCYAYSRDGEVDVTNWSEVYAAYGYGDDDHD